MKLKYVIQICKSLFLVKNTMDNTNVMNAISHKVFRYIMVYRGGGEFLNVLKHIYISLNIKKLTFHSDVLKNVSYI